MSEQVRKTIEEVAFDLAETNELSKYSKEERDKLRDAFFSLANEEVQCASKTVVVPDWVTDVKDYVARYHGDWIHDPSSFDDTSRKLILTEKPSGKEFSIVVTPGDEEELVVNSKGKEGLGFVVTRSIRTTTPSFDLDRVATHDPDLYARITDNPSIPPYVHEVLTWVCSSDDSIAPGLNISRLEKDWLSANPQSRPLKAEEEIKLGDKAKLKKHYLISPASTSVLNVRLAKEEEL